MVLKNFKNLFYLEICLNDINLISFNKNIPLLINFLPNFKLTPKKLLRYMSHHVQYVSHTVLLFCHSRFHDDFFKFIFR